MMLAKHLVLPLEEPRHRQAFTRDYLDLRPSVAEVVKGNVMPTRCDIRAITRGVQAHPGAALILGGLLLLSIP
jgi:hypothetical protein